MTTDDSAGTESVMSLAAAAEALGVQPQQVDAMIDEGLLNPVEGHAEPMLDAAQVHAVRNQGG